MDSNVSDGRHRAEGRARYQNRLRAPEVHFITARHHKKTSTVQGCIIEMYQTIEKIEPVVYNPFPDRVHLSGWGKTVHRPSVCVK